MSSWFPKLKISDLLTLRKLIIDLVEFLKQSYSSHLREENKNDIKIANLQMKFQLSQCINKMSLCEGVKVPKVSENQPISLRLIDEILNTIDQQSKQIAVSNSGTNNMRKKLMKKIKKQLISIRYKFIKLEQKDDKLPTHLSIISSDQLIMLIFHIIYCYERLTGRPCFIPKELLTDILDDEIKQLLAMDSKNELKDMICELKNLQLHPPKNDNLDDYFISTIYQLKQLEKRLTTIIDKYYINMHSTNKNPIDVVSKALSYFGVMLITYGAYRFMGKGK